ncbi:MAG: hypothetical protein HY656_02685 [Acidobacteria bacterium]|nr:hypothetical protein [Acidobacteriota bacterium]
MKRPPIEKLRRLALVGVVAVGLVLAVSYGVRRWRAYQARRAVPVAIAGDVEQQAEKFTFSRSEAGRTLFTVQASRTIERTGKTTVLEDVVAVIYGRDGGRTDEIRTRRCEYDANGTGEITCPGEVTVRLGGGPASDATQMAGAVVFATAGVRFDTRQGAAWTDQAVRFSFPEGSGEAIGLRYQAQEPTARLERQVRIGLNREGGAPVEIQGSQFHYYARNQVLELLPPLSLESDGRLLVADRLRMELDTGFRARRIEATGNVRARGKQGDRELALRAPRAVALYAPDGSLERLEARDGVELIGRSPQSEERLTCREAVLSFDTLHREVHRVVATGAADLLVRTGEETRELRAPVLELTLRGPGQAEQELVASQRGTLEIKRPGEGPRTLAADRIELRSEDKQRLKSLAGSGGVETKAVRPDGSEQATASDELRARFDREGKLAEAEQWGRFRYHDARWRAEAGRALYNGVAGNFRLSEQPAVWDATIRVTARTLELAETSGAFEADGDVRTTRQPAGPNGEPVHFAAARLRAERQRGWARYEGQARMWAGPNRLAAHAIELFDNPRKLAAAGQVSGLFIEESPTKENSAQAAGPPRALTVTSERFTYLEAERRGVFEENVKARNDFGLLTAPRLEVFLAAAGGQSSQSLERAHAEGGVRIEQPGGHAESERADYRADTRTVVLSGGTPTIVDAQRSTITGAQLTLFLADGTIQVSSAEGTRTVTRRPWAR